MRRAIVDTFVAPPCEQSIERVFEDEDILVISKPSGLLSLSGKDPRNHDSVHARLTSSCPEAHLVHRLDFGTSGLMVVAKSKSVVVALNRQFQLRQVTKQYTALLTGVLSSDEGVIEAPIARDDAHFPRMQISVQGKPARSRYRVVHRNFGSQQTRVTYLPETGRTHQLRIHSAHIGHPIVGCDIYGAAVSTSRLMLHAHQLSFVHPITDQPMTLNSACPF